VKCKTASPAIGETPKLLRAAGCMAAIWPDPTERPSLRYFKELQAKGYIPFVRIGRLLFFDPAEVRRALDHKFRVESFQ
jgi:hypothetical protein